MWRQMDRHYYICTRAEKLIHSPSALSTALLWESYHFPLRACWFMTMTFIFHSHSISRWWMGWSLPAVTLGLVFCLTLCCSAALTDLPAGVYMCQSAERLAHQHCCSPFRNIKKKDVKCVYVCVCLIFWSMMLPCVLELERGEDCLCAPAWCIYLCLSSLSDCFMLCGVLSLKAVCFNTSCCCVFKETFMWSCSSKLIDGASVTFAHRRAVTNSALCSAF